MKRIFKGSLALLVVFTMVLCSISAFAATSDIYSSHVEFTGDSSALSASAFVYSPTDASAQLILAVYDSTGKLVDAKSASGANTILTTEAVNAGSNTVKAFVWADDTKEVISEVATYNANFESILDTLEITFDGQSFSDYIGSDFNKNTTTYAKDLDAAGAVEIPDVRASVEDNGAFVTVSNTEISDTQAKTEITVSYGQREVESGTTSTNNPDYADDGLADREVYSYANTRTYTITYTNDYAPVKDESKIYLEDLKTTTDPSIMIGNDRKAGSYNFNRKYAETVGLGEEEFTKVTVNITGNSKQNFFIVVKPMDDQYKGQVIGEPDNPAAPTSVSLPAQIDDTNVRVSYNEQDSTTTWGKMSQKAIVTTAYNEVPSTNRVYYGMFGTDWERATGARFVSDRQPMDAHMALYTVPAGYEGCEYIAPPSETGSSADSTASFEFYIMHDAEISVWTKADLTVSINETPAENESPAEYFTGGYTNRLVAAANKNANYTAEYSDYIKLIEALLVYSGAIENVDYKISGVGDVTIINYSMPEGYGYNDDPGRFGSLYKLVIEEDGEIVNPNKDSRFVGKTAAEIAESFATLGESGYGSVTSELVSDIAWANKTYSTGLPVLRKFDVTVTQNDGTSFGILGDRTNFGGVTKYPGVFELYNTDILCPYLDWVNGGADKEHVIDFTTGDVKPWYQFKVNDDVRVMVFAYGAVNYAERTASVDPGWTYIALSEDNYINVTAQSHFNASSVSVKEFSEGDTVTIYTPGIYAMYYVVVVPAN